MGWTEITAVLSHLPIYVDKKECCPDTPGMHNRAGYGASLMGTVPVLHTSEKKDALDCRRQSGELFANRKIRCRKILEKIWEYKGVLVAKISLTYKAVFLYTSSINK